MTRVTGSADFTNFSTDVKFRTWGSAVNVLLSGSGLVQTADSGQINWTTVTKPTAGNSAGYEIWRFNDALQSTTPIFFKIFYGCGPISGNVPAFRGFVVGSGSDGAGNIIGAQTPLAFGASSQYNITSSYTSNHSMISTHTSGYWMMSCDSVTTTQAPNNQLGTFFIDRSRSQVDGTPTGDGWTVGYLSATPRGTLVTWTCNKLVGYTDGNNFITEGLTIPSNQASGWGSRIFPFYVSTPTPKQQIGAIGVGRADIAQKATFTCYPIGNTIRRTYINLMSPATNYGMANNTDATDNCGMALLWED